MNKADFVAKVAENSGLTRRQAESAVTAFVQTITDALKAGDKVQLMGFGTFEVKDRPARVGHNPATGAEMEIAASKAPVFHPGKKFKDEF